MSCGDIFLGLIAILFPPVAVWIKSGLCTADSAINILLCMLGYLPGLLHAWYIIAKNPEYDYEAIPEDPESNGGRVTYYYVAHEPARRSQNQQTGYGTNNSNNNARIAPKPKTQPQHSSGPRDTRPVSPVPHSRAGEGVSGENSNSNSNPPPSYADVVQRDHKVQRQE